MGKVISYYTCATCADKPELENSGMKAHLLNEHGLDATRVKCEVTLSELVIHKDGHYQNKYRMAFETGVVVKKVEDIYLDVEDDISV